MAEAVVSMVVEMLGNLLIEEVKFMQGVGDQVRDIRDELWWMQCFLKDADSRQYDDHRVRTWVREIKEIAYDAGDALESFIAGVESRKGGSILKVLERFSCLMCEGMARHNTGSRIQDIETRISKLTTRLQTYGIRSFTGEKGSLSSENQRESQLRRSYSYIDQYDFVGQEEDVERLVNHLVDEDHRVIAICGMGGLGKTTLAKRVYNRKEVEDHFEKRVWVCISQQWDLRNILEDILNKLTGDKKTLEDSKKWNIENFVEEISKIQREKRCLVVLDDIWHDGAWNSLKDAFPIMNMKGKLLLTSRSKEVPRHVNVNVKIHEPGILEDDECWELLQKKAFITPNDPDLKKKETLAAEMLKKCSGLPLAVTVLGGILATKKSLSEWEIVRDSIKSYIRRGAGIRNDVVGGGVSDILGLSYNDLPYQLKPCFLYLAKYDEDTEIPTESLYQMWMAESMILSEDRRENEAMIDVAESYLEELAQRCMVHVQLADPLKGRRRFKSCSLHDLMRDLSLSKENEQNFFHTIDFRDCNIPDGSLPNEYSKIRRLVFYHDDENTSSRNFSLDDETRKCLRSLFFIIETSDYVSCTMPPMVKSKLKNFKMLRVLQIEGLKPRVERDANIMKIIFSRREYCTLPKAVGKLIHMRYFGVKNSQFLFFPSSIKNWKQLQTLYLGFDYPAFIGCQAKVLQKMRQLQHLYLPKRTVGVFCSSTNKLQLDYLIKLETLENFGTAWCDSKGLYKLVKLRRLTATLDNTGEGEQVIEFLNSGAAPRMKYCKITLNWRGNIDTEEGNVILRELLTCDRLSRLKIQFNDGSKIPRYDEVQVLSKSLTSIYMYGGKLIEDPMPTLEKLPNLQSLDIRNSCKGNTLFFSEKGFP